MRGTHSAPMSASPRLMYSMGTLANSGLTVAMIFGFGCLNSGRASLLGSDLAGTCCDCWAGPGAKLWGWADATWNIFGEVVVSG